jgi:hypothetical protein
LLNPVRGVGFGSYETFASFCRQHYPDYEILFAVNDGAEPAVPGESPLRRIRLFAGAERLGANRKVEPAGSPGAARSWTARRSSIFCFAARIHGHPMNAR